MARFCLGICRTLRSRRAEEGLSTCRLCGTQANQKVCPLVGLSARDVPTKRSVHQSRKKVCPSVTHRGQRAVTGVSRKPAGRSVRLSVSACPLLAAVSTCAEGLAFSPRKPARRSVRLSVSACPLLAAVSTCAEGLAFSHVGCFLVSVCRFHRRLYLRKRPVHLSAVSCAASTGGCT